MRNREDMKNNQWYGHLKTLVLIVNFAVAIWLITMTGPKLYKMFQIKEWISGSVAHEVRVTQKWTEQSDYSDAYWIAWSDKSIKVPGNHRTNVEEDVWVATEIGSPIQIITVDDRGTPYLRNGIFVSVGNFVFDFVLLTVELLIIIFVPRKLYVTIVKEKYWKTKHHTPA